MEEIKGFPDYFVDKDGNIYSKKRNKGIFKKLIPLRANKYLQVGLWIDGKCYQKKIHRIVAQTFIPNPKNKPEVNHKNGDKYNNKVDNLEWVTRSENERHKCNVLNRKGGWYGKRPGWGSFKNKFGVEHPSSKKVVQLYKGKIVGIYGSQLEAERKTGIKATNISMCCTGKIKKAKGYVWKYI